MEWSAGARIWGQIMVMHLEIETRGAGSECFSMTPLIPSAQNDLAQL